ncbi:enoyl-CoA hydratase-related protein [Acidithrix sp. C25]|uniref:enoyl-CoA hydratase-related protein n=1 Tax=Acidithrix sp. C25 TaxID=1671482 RepID=UPI00191BB92E|nr:enoyl-CoA hydratase-related protein [Acidithrix sp. C25]CAG4920099.1 unnamed protein product [Acidithrix sp. C25]
MSGSVTTRVIGSIAEVLITNPERKNAISQDMWGQLDDSIRLVDSNDYVKVVIVHGGDGNFVAGADISEFKDLRQSGQSSHTYDENTEKALLRLRRTSKVTIALIEGYCIGGGVSIAVACDFRIGAANSIYQVPPARLGISYPLGSLSRLVELVGPTNAKWMIFTAARLSAVEAESIGLIRSVASEAIWEYVDDLARQISENAPLSIMATKRVIEALSNGGDSVADVANEMSEKTLSSRDYLEALEAFSQKRQPKFEGR